MNLENNIKIIPYNLSHQQQVIDLILNIQQLEFNVPITIGDQPDLLSVDAVYRNGNGNFWVALDNEKVIGTIALIDFGNNQAALRKMFVHKDYRGKEKAVAQLLYNNLEDWCREKNINEIILGTITKLVAAIKFYLRNGFVEVEKEMLPVNFPVMEVDNLFLIKKLDMDSPEKVDMFKKFSLVHSYWDPKIAGELNGQQVKLVKFKGDFVWHHHENEDEMFYVVKGSFIMQFKDKDVRINEGEFIIVPKGTEHKPCAEEEVWVMLFEPATTLNTGNTENNFTKKELETI